MNKTLKINISGIVFQIEEDAFEILRNYLFSLSNRLKSMPDGNETIEDIETRIAEIFQSQKGSAGIISKENVEAMIGIIGKPEEFETGEEPDSSPEYKSIRRRLYRNRDDSIIGGVCGGIGAYLNCDPVWIRIAIIILTFFFGAGGFIYIALWIALPPAITEYQKRELHGEFYHSAGARRRGPGNRGAGDSPQSAGYNGFNRFGNAINEIFRAIGKCFVIFFRIILIIIGVMFVITGFLSLISFIVIFFFRFPGLIQTNSFNSDVLYLPDYLNYFFTPAMTSWMVVLIVIAVALPLLAIIYWGVKMIFQFRAKDGILSLSLLLTWIAVLVIMSAIFFRQGLGFAESGRKTEKILFNTPSDTIYFRAGNRISAAHYDREIFIPDENYRIGLNDSSNILFIQPQVVFIKSDDTIPRVEITRSSQGRTKSEALKKAENLQFNWRISNDTLVSDEYFTVPPEFKWSGGELELIVFLPEGTIVRFDQSSEIFNSPYRSYDNDFGDTGNNYWIMTNDGFMQTSQQMN
jgi:phage shock protein PspC (stress-responsive transcriptional regulator)